MASGENGRSSTWVKICGVRDVATALCAVNAGADAIGLNFYAGSPRSVSASVACEIRDALPSSCAAVGVFVNSRQSEVVDIAATVGLTHLQFHGDESAQFLSAVACEASDLKIVRAWRVGNEGLTSLRRYLEEIDGFAVTLEAVLVDSRAEGQYGGTGKVAPWELLRQEWEADWPKLILAGGLTPANVAHAIRQVGPWGVDTASGVEISAGVKKPELIAAFIEQARRGE